MLKKGEEYKGFYVIDITDVKDYKCTGIYLRHKTTGLEVFHLLNDDEENLFSFCFRTPVQDSKGLPHVIEHSVLCGSEKFRLKHPFNTLRNRSVNTFLNALTHPDITFYPGAALIEKQYFDIMDVYADSVFFSLLTENTFKQEAHRFELDDNGNISIQGVVYNEMKELFSDFSSCVNQNLYSSLFPGTTYEYSSGGDPLEICNVTYKEFTDYHKNYYSPENCLLYLYGNIPTEKQLDFIAENYIPRLEEKFNLKIERADYKAPLPKVYDEIKALETITPPAEMRETRFLAPKGIEGNIVALSFFAGVPEVEQILLRKLLREIICLLLRKLLIEAKLASDCIDDTVCAANQYVFVFKLVGVKKEDEQEAKNLILDSLKGIYEAGFTQDQIDGAINSLKFSFREIKRNGGPFSIDILEKVMDGWNFGLHPAEKLTLISSLDKLKEKLNNDSNYLTSLMKKYFINKPYVVTVIEPSESFLKGRNIKEMQFIAEKSKTIDKAVLKKELDALHEYQNRQDSPEALASIPYLKLSELPKKLPRKEAEIEKLESGIYLFTDKINTNKIIYFKLLFPFDLLEPKDYLDMNLYCNSMFRVSGNKKTLPAYLDKVLQGGGGLKTSLVVSYSVETEKSLKFLQNYKNGNFFDRDWIIVDMLILEELLPETFDLIAEFLNGVDYKDTGKLKNIIINEQYHAKTCIVSKGDFYCFSRADCSENKVNAVLEIIEGITQFKHLLAYKSEDTKKLLKKFKRIYKTIRDSGCIINITADEDSIEKAKALLPDFISKADLKPLKPRPDYTKEDFLKHVYKYIPDEFDVIKADTQVGCASSVFKYDKPFTKKTAAMELLLSWITEHTFWEKLRTVHGCYDAKATIGNDSSIVDLSTYSDPNPKESFAIFIDCLKEAAAKNFGKEDIECAVLSLYSKYAYPDEPEVHGVKAFYRVLDGITQEQIDDYVKYMLELTPADLKEAAENLLAASQNSRRAMFCSNETETNGNILKID